ncbi:MAG: hypothetical protein LBH51_06025 [Treponema sp.]|nr:hypothetical protein [Treponema sp.]
MPGASEEPPLELLRPTILIGDGAFLESLYRRESAPAPAGFWPRIPRPLVQYLKGRRLIRALGGNVRFYGFTAGPEPGAETEEALGRVHLPRARILSGEGGSGGPAAAARPLGLRTG